MTPVLVLLPGMDGTGELFQPLLRALDPGFPVVVVRYPDAPLDYAGHESIARNTLPRNAPYILVGESFSGPIALSIAADNPVGLLGFVLVASFSQCPSSLLRRLPAASQLFARWLLPTFAVQRMLLGRHATRELIQMLSTALDQVSTATIRSRLRALATVDVNQRLREIRVPGLYLQATADRLVPPACGNSIADIVPNLRIEAIDAPHMLLQTAPLAAARLIFGFSNSVNSARTTGEQDTHTK